MTPEQIKQEDFDIKLMSINLAFNYHLKTNDTNDLNQILDKSFETSKNIRQKIKEHFHKVDKDQPNGRIFNVPL